VSRLDHIAIEEKVVVISAAHGRNPYRYTFYIQFIQRFRHELVYDAVSAAGAKMRGDICEGTGFYHNYSHFHHSFRY
jgi:hypothetical protein